jgi:hypothetical protein
MSIKSATDTVGNRTRDVSSCSTLPEEEIKACNCPSEEGVELRRQAR